MLGAGRKAAAVLLLLQISTGCSLQGESQYKFELATALEQNSSVQLSRIVCPSSSLTSHDISILLFDTYSLYNIKSIRNFDARRGDSELFVYQVQVTSRSGRVSTQLLEAPKVGGKFCPAVSPIFALR